MSYCRWSSDDFRCDLYCYEDVSGGYTTHVAGTRYPDGARPASLELALEDFDRYRAENAAWEQKRDTIEMVPIGKQFDGQSFNDATLEDFLSRVKTLAAAGYNVPAWLITNIEQEMAETQANTTA